MIASFFHMSSIPQTNLHKEIHDESLSHDFSCGKETLYLAELGGFSWFYKWGKVVGDEYLIWRWGVTINASGFGGQIIYSWRRRRLTNSSSTGSKRNAKSGGVITPSALSPNLSRTTMDPQTCSSGIAKSLDPRRALGKEAVTSSQWTLLTTTQFDLPNAFSSLFSPTPTSTPLELSVFPSWMSKKTGSPTSRSNRSC